MNQSSEQFGVSIAGEFSNAINDCGLYLIGVNQSANYGEGCEYWMDANEWSPLFAPPCENARSPSEIYSKKSRS